MSAVREKSEGEAMILTGRKSNFLPYAGEMSYEIKRNKESRKHFGCQLVRRRTSKLQPLTKGMSTSDMLLNARIAFCACGACGHGRSTSVTS